MAKYSVLLLYPDYLTDSPETYLAHVEGFDPADAALVARNQLAKRFDVGNPLDFKVLAVFRGHLTDLNSEG